MKLLMRSRFLIALLLLFCSSPIYAQLQPAKIFTGNNKSHHTKVSLLANVKHIQPGVPFTVGVLMKMEEGWHTYWKNPGETGLPTEIKWRMPEGFTAGEIQWPLPHKYNEAGDILTFGYETENLLLVEISPPSSLKSGSSIVLKADVNWLECEKLCVPGSEQVEIKLPVASGEPEHVNADIFEKYRRQVPRPLSAGGEMSITTDAKNGVVEFHLTPTGRKHFDKSTTPDFYAETVGDVVLGRTQVSGGDARASVRLLLSAPEKINGPLTLRGVVIYRLDGEEQTSAAVEVPLSKEFIATIPSAIESSSSPTEESLLDRKFNSIETAQAQQPLYMYVLFAVLGGLLLNIMPCVLPVIALKIFGLVKMARNNPADVRKSGWFFSLGILVSFLSLACAVALLKAAGESVGWGFQFQEPLFVIAMSTLVFAFGLSLFGVYEITLPGLNATSAAIANTEQKKGFVGPFSEGIFATILATPCTAPILGTALGFAFAQPTYVTFLIFTATAFGMALPYLILTMKPAWMKFLPKPGAWMVAAKQFMGFLMMATVVWLLYILGAQLGMEAVIWTSAFLLFVGVACWMVGTFATLTATRTRSVATWIAALLVVVIGYMIFVSDIMKAKEILSNSSQRNPTVSSNGVNSLDWEPFTLERLEKHLKENKSVFIDFTAEWCLTCKVNEKSVLVDEEVIKSMKSGNIVTMRADWTNRNDTIARLLAKFGRSGVPLYVIFPAGKPTEPIVLPEVITPNIVLSALKKASGV